MESLRKPQAYHRECADEDAESESIKSYISFNSKILHYLIEEDTKNYYDKFKSSERSTRMNRINIGKKSCFFTFLGLGCLRRDQKDAQESQLKR